MTLVKLATSGTLHGLIFFTYCGFFCTALADTLYDETFTTYHRPVLKIRVDICILETF